MVVIRFACANTSEAFIRVNGLNIVSSNSSTTYYGFTMPLNEGDVVSTNDSEYIHANTRFSFYKAK